MAIKRFGILSCVVLMACASTEEEKTSNLNLHQFEMKQNMSADANKRLEAVFHSQGTYFPGAALRNFRANEPMVFLNLEIMPMVKDIKPKEAVRAKIAFQQDSLIETLNASVEYTVKQAEGESPESFEFVRINYPRDAIRIAPRKKASQ